MSHTAKTQDGETYDTMTGEVAEPPKRGRFGRALRSPEEEAAAERVREERKALRREQLAVLRELAPACEAEGDPPVVWKNLTPLSNSAAPATAPLLTLDRLSGKGLPGSKLVVAGRYVDGMNGGEPKYYAAIFALYRGSQGHLLRSQGVAVRAEELRQVAAALTDYAEQLESTPHAKETK